MDEDRKREILAKAHATLERLAESDRRRAFEQWQRGSVDDVDNREDALVRWERLRLQSVEPPKPEPPKPPQRRVTPMDPETLCEIVGKAMAAYVTKRLKEFSSLMGEEVAHTQNELIAKLRAETEARFKKLEAQLADLGVNKNDVVDLPALPLRLTGPHRYEN